MVSLGLIVNPLAGIGGRVGLKGSDGEETVRRAFELGAVCLSPGRATEALLSLDSLAVDLELVTYSGPMGEEEASAAGLAPIVLGSIDPVRTTSADTRRAAAGMLELGVDLLLFAGGDGTARDVYDVVGDRAPVLGIPSGCKIHSGVFAGTPRAAGELARLFLEGVVTRTTELEVMDIDEEAFRHDELRARLHGYLRVPHEPRLTQGSKAGGRGLSEEATVTSIAERIVEEMRPGALYLVGSGTTPRGIMRRLDLPHTLLGIDVVRDGRLVAADVGERELLDLLGGGRDAEMFVTPIGGQGFIFGRGNQQLSPEVIRRVGADNVRVIATPGKLVGLPFHRMRVDTGDAEVDASLRGYRQVVTGYRESSVVEVV